MSSDTTTADVDDEDSVTNRSEIVFAYDAEDTNPNGNPLSANDKPRIDETTGTAVVTDVRLKRYLRDQLDDDGFGIYIQNPSKSDSDSVLDRDDLFTSVTGLDESDLEDISGSRAADKFLMNAVDVRYFGATGSFSQDFRKSLGDSFPGQFIGPVQFSHARSLNTVVQKGETKQLSTVVSSGGDAEQGTFATDNRLQYAFIPFHGIVNEVGASDTNLSQTDVERLDTLLWRAVKNQTLTRSKMGHQPRLYLRVEYETDAFHIGTLDDGLELTQETPDTELRNITDVVVGIDELLTDLETYSDHIASVKVTADRHLTVEANGETGGPEHLVGALEDAVGADTVDEVDPYA
ncbi:MULTISPECIES: type I-B CRISPR-associated protein Cas7/Csh2 [unclassified Haloferax]|uniref:type I-B CRISPR-associated protein Cas7/Csh2 n=1 Tax=unclassified Haloferax TaxID=2625095 RepID=UPI0002B06706|nr:MULTISPECIES: type I-B CRISPR-associated protein Cas7/Csh2 [unclassified Haloferax]ELZ57865.1 Csh2 family CRISPR-associated protein [Haloferax sp. ATCC BAA-646]ELZ62649.1 Csh2 family CRISPR-associated protein [Haloferax sp. ATCC BAA-645]ELZ63792.1 Csh2 family CRISPR-associated protein [Haloferax sp. ATCC BAA-644]